MRGSRTPRARGPAGAEVLATRLTSGPTPGVVAPGGEGRNMLRVFLPPYL